MIVTVRIPVWSKTQAELVPKCLEHVLREFPNTPVALFVHDSSSLSGIDIPKGVVVTRWNGRAEGLYRVPDSSYLVIVSPWVELTSGWLEEHLTDMEADPHLAVVGGWGNPDFYSGSTIDHVVTTANHFGEQGYCELVRGEVLTVRAAALSDVTDWPDNIGAEIDWVCLALAEHGWRVKKGAGAGSANLALAPPHPILPAANEVRYRFAARRLRSRTAMRRFMETGAWPDHAQMIRMVTVRIPVWSKTQAELVPKCLDHVLREFPNTPVTLLVHDDVLLSGTDVPEGVTVTPWNGRADQLFTQPSSAYLVIVSPWVELTSGWLEEHLTDMEAEARLAVVGGWGNPDFYSGSTIDQVVTIADYFGEQGYCELVRGEVLTVRAAALSDVTDWPKQAGCETDWLCLALAERGWRVRKGVDAGAADLTGAPRYPRYPGSNEVRCRFTPRGGQPRAAIRQFMNTGEWPSDYSEIITGLYNTLLERTDRDSRRQVFDEICRIDRTLLNQAHHSGAFSQGVANSKLDCLARVEVLTTHRPKFERCVVTVASAGYEEQTIDMYNSCRTRGNLGDAGFVVFAVGSAAEVLAKVPGITVIPCRALLPLCPAVKSIVYSAARFIDFDTMISIETDMIVCNPLNDLFEEIAARSDAPIFSCPTGSQMDEGRAFWEQLQYGEFALRDVELITGRSYPHQAQFFYFNGGMIAGRKAAWAQLDSCLLEYAPLAQLWVETERLKVPWADEVLFNMALYSQVPYQACSRTYNALIFDGSLDYWFTIEGTGKNARVYWRSEPAVITHFVYKAKDARKPFWESIK